MKYLFSTIVIVFVFTSCKDETFGANTIDIEYAFNQAQEILLSDFVKHIDYVILESENPIGGYVKVYSNGNYLICMMQSRTERHIYLFDRQTGALIREIGSYGRGPGEYSKSEYFDSETQHVIVSRLYEGLIEYDLNGKMTCSISAPKEYLWNRMFLDKSTIVYYVMNTSGDVKERLLIADESGNVLKTFPNPYSFKSEGIIGINTVFYHHGGNTLFFENRVDTIYSVTKEALIPHFHLNLGKYHPPYEKTGDFITPSTTRDPLVNQYFMFERIGETNAFLFFDFEYKKPSATVRSSFFGYYDKNKKTAKIADVDNNNKRRIVNDIDHFDALQLSSWWIDDRRNEMISYIDAMDVAEWFENNPQQAKELPEHLQKLSKLKSDDNPVVVIAKLK